MKITIGLATCGISAGAKPVFDALKDANLPVEKVGCIGMCYNEPVVTVIDDNKKSIYGNVTIDNVNKLIECIKKGEECKELLVANDINELDFYKKQNRLVMENCGLIDPLNLEQYKENKGYSGLNNALKLEPKQVIEQIKISGLRGRGGAGFPTAIKWGFLADKKGKKYLICNGDEGDPGAFMNRTVMESDPFKLIEGITIGAYATGTEEGIIYTRAEYPLAIETLEKALKIAYDNNLLGNNILGKEGFNFKLYIQKGAGAFVCGEETAMINSIEGKRGMPKPRPPYPAEKGLYGKPTNVNNVGTWAHVATIMKIGASEYAKIGTEKTKGTKVVCLTGKIKRTGIVEVPMGTKLRDIVYEIGGGTPEGTEFKAILSGGPAGGCIPKEHLDTPLDYETLQALGAIMGSGGMVVINNEACMVDVARYFMNFTQEESCGKCTPCREGTKRLLEMLIKVTRGVGGEKDIDKIRQLAEFVRDNALCGLGQNAPNSVLSTLRFFRDEYVMHLKDKTCCAGACANLLKYNITDKCVGCGNCARHCPVGCISGEPRKKHVIDQEKCIKCGTCYEVCAFKAIKKT
ncbi:MAG: 4Fe-4S binding protein [Nanoarchaeota archaeon]|nr:4Fe-4S binding protein [Nanoarchaeota archaeon]MBU1005942.1 4Fe-4S binding protein [Nanoarchaeota archaeon]MBU1947069.1 4Fe-4S binding protein [Nanoarchaeota archaeon]